MLFRFQAEDGIRDSLEFRRVLFRPYVDIDLDVSFNYGIQSVHTYIVLFHAASQISSSIKQKLTEWNKTVSDNGVKIVRYQVLADACATQISGTPCRLAVVNAVLSINEKDGHVTKNTSGVTTVRNSYSMDTSKSPADLMVGDDLLRQVKYHQEHPVRINDVINIGATYGACVLIQFTGAVDAEEFKNFMATEQVLGSSERLPAYLVPEAESNGGRVFVGFMKDDSELDFQNILDAEYAVGINGHCAMKFKEES